MELKAVSITWAYRLRKLNQASDSVSSSECTPASVTAKLSEYSGTDLKQSSPLHPLIRTMPHAAFKIADLDASIRGKDVLLGPYEPIPNFRVAIIEDGGFPVELIQTTLTEEELWRRPEANNILYSGSAPRVDSHCQQNWIVPA